MRLIPTSNSVDRKLGDRRMGQGCVLTSQGCPLWICAGIGEPGGSDNASTRKQTIGMPKNQGKLCGRLDSRDFLPTENDLRRRERRESRGKINVQNCEDPTTMILSPSRPDDTQAPRIVGPPCDATALASICQMPSHPEWVLAPAHRPVHRWQVDTTGLS
ncbi:hypothetical protein GGTG_07435 [Gaeumannomyces tritici R3-111a-1]|uniref:Uncharacterized protein n=1 Tax=Gaeumannomyces tritici (strain R3-111a-1) TaxID=644352 RepID=J3P1N7_GAET3|nr:hypothetical protein GGTG_07435 [Gaeumannomyces tritici R3-111a-1]EJT73579.1 hypothetical protein GGTG_07435 [Gaeumannomyces tritici R3-111a-1]